ncbi:MAG TPA: MFS transporter, partial [Micrococcaceae bacterium]
QVWHLYVVAGAVGVATVFFDVSYQSYIPILIPGSAVADANSKLESTAQVSRIAGPGAGGFLLTVITAPALFIGEALGYLASAVFLWRTRDSEQPVASEDRRPLVSEIREGLSFVVRHPLISRIVLCTAGLNLFSAITYTMFPVLVLRQLDLGAAGLGLILSVGSLGGLLGAFSAVPISRKIGEGTLIPVSALVSVAFVMLVPVAALVHQRGTSLVLLMVSEFGFSFAVLAYNIMQVTMRQRVCPPRLLGRMNASIRFVVYGVMPLSALISGLLAQYLGLVPTLWIGAIGGLPAVASVVFSPLRKMKKLPDSQAGQPDAADDPESAAEGPAGISSAEPMTSSRGHD